jgi:hypothetical protein
MSYRSTGSRDRLRWPGLGQAKWVPGQISFASLPPGQTSLPSLQPLVEAGLPIAPYIEHGSFETGEPAIMRYGRDPYRGLGQDQEREFFTDFSAIVAGAALIVAGQLIMDWGIGYTTVTTIVPLRNNGRRRRKRR